MSPELHARVTDALSDTTQTYQLITDLASALQAAEGRVDGLLEELETLRGTRRNLTKENAELRLQLDAARVLLEAATTDPKPHSGPI